MKSMNRFSFNPTNLDIPRSLFDRSCDRFMSMQSAKLNVIYCDEMLPGDSVTMKTTSFIRMSKPVLPSMDPLYCDVFYFFVPMRLIWNNYKQFFGENDSTAWTRATDKVLPALDATSIASMLSIGAYKSGCLLDQLGIHLGDYNPDTATVYGGKTPLDALEGITTLPIRAYECIANEWFRDENYEAPYVFSKGDAGTYDEKVGGYIHGVNHNFVHIDGLYHVNALHDYFTSALPAPQKGPDIRPLGEGFGALKVVTGEVHTDVDSVQTDGLYMKKRAGGYPTGSAALLFGNNTGAVSSSSASTTYNAEAGVVPTNLWANLPVDVFASVNQIRYSFALQRFLEKSARGGSRYKEVVRAHFGVTGSDSSMMIPEYVGGERFMLNMDTILTTADTPTGTTGEYAGYSKTFQNLPQWSFSSTEHGYLLGLCCIRPKMTYHQGIPRMFTRKDQLDFYWPSFANLGEQPILKKEIYAANPASGDNDGVFGYNEAYCEYRTKPSELVGALRPESEDFIHGYTFARSFISQSAATAVNARDLTPDIVGQNLAVVDGTQFISHFHFDAKWRRPMPVYSIPGLVDHH